MQAALEPWAFFWIFWVSLIQLQFVRYFALILVELMAAAFELKYYFWTMVTTMAGKFAIGAAFGLIYLYTAELYPTVIRTQAVGSGSMVSRAGSIMAPFSINLSSIWIFIPQLLIGCLAFVSGILTFQLPETLRKPLISTWEEATTPDAEKEGSSGKLSPTTSNTDAGQTRSD